MVLDVSRLRRGSDSGTQRTEEDSRSSSGSGSSQRSSGTRSGGNSSVFALNESASDKSSGSRFAVGQGNCAERSRALDDLQDVLREEYGINYGFQVNGNRLTYGGFGNVACTLTEDSKAALYEEMAKSYDSVLDLVVDEKLNAFMQEHGVRQWQDLYDDPAMIEALREEAGLVFQSVQIDTGNKDYDSRQFMVSMVDDEGNVIQDENGNYAQLIKSDSLLPDGYAQQVEMFPSALLESLGYDAVSVLDLTPEEYQKVKEMAGMDPSELGQAYDGKGIFDAAAEWTDATFTQKDWIYKHYGPGGNGGSYTISMNDPGAGSGGTDGDASGIGGDTELVQEANQQGKQVVTQSQYNKLVTQYAEDHSTTVNIATQTIAQNYVVGTTSEANASKKSGPTRTTI